MSLDAASFASGGRRPLRELQARFMQRLWPAIRQFCDKRLDKAAMQQCLREAAEHSGWGRFTLAHNYWMLPGRGDAGAFLLVRVDRTPHRVAHGGFAPTVETYAKFSSLAAALDAWCKSKGR